MKCSNPVELVLEGKRSFVACGVCLQCRRRKVSEWQFRLEKEEEMSISSLFVTLTYDDLHVPYSEKGNPTLNTRDIQLFMKLVRRRQTIINRRLAGDIDEGEYFPNPKIIYYLCGEYGKANGRPHYHMIIFNASEDAIRQSWTNGLIHIGSVSGASIGYTLKYMCKPKVVPAFQGDDRLREKAYMSKGLGLSFLTENMLSWYDSNKEERTYIPARDGKKIAMPRYFRDRIFLKEDMLRMAEKGALEFIEQCMEEIDKLGLEESYKAFRRKKTEMAQMILNHTSNQRKL